MAGRRRDLDENISEIVRLYSEENWAINEIANEFGCTYPTIVDRLKKAGVSVQKKWFRRRDLDENLREIIRLFQEEHWSINKIARKFNCAGNAISPRLREAGCELTPGHKFRTAEDHPFWRGEDSTDSKLTWFLQEKDSPCMDCGMQWPPYVMEFDHVPERGPKLFMVNSKATSRSYSLAELREERAKCDLVCRNCHAIRTHIR